jgi:hypothetical protein
MALALNKISEEVKCVSRLMHHLSVQKFVWESFHIALM